MTTRRAYEETNVAVGTSQEAIKRLIRAAGGSDIDFGQREAGDVAYHRLEFLHEGYRVRIVAVQGLEDVPAKGRDPNEQEARRVWRVLHWTLKARLVAVAEGVELFAESFLPFLVDERTDRTVWEVTLPELQMGALKASGPRLLTAGAR